MIVITIAFVSGIPAAYMPESLNAETSHAYHAQVSFISVVCRSSDLSIHVRRVFPRTNALLQPSLRAMTALPMTGFHRTRGIPPHGKQYFRITATFGILPRACNLKCTDCNPAIDSFRVRDLHPIPLFSEQACVSDCSGRAFATKAMLFSLLYARLFYAHKKTSPALLSRRQKKSRVLYIFSFGVRKNYLFI